MKATGKNQTYPAVLTPAEEGGFDVSFPRFPGCFTSGDSYEEAVANAAEALSAYLEVLRQEEPEVLSNEETGRPIIADISIRS